MHITCHIITHVPTFDKVTWIMTLHNFCRTWWSGGGERYPGQCDQHKPHPPITLMSGRVVGLANYKVTWRNSPKRMKLKETEKCQKHYLYLSKQTFSLVTTFLQDDSLVAYLVCANRKIDFLEEWLRTLSSDWWFISKPVSWCIAADAAAISKHFKEILRL